MEGRLAAGNVKVSEAAQTKWRRDIDGGWGERLRLCATKPESESMGIVEK